MGQQFQGTPQQQQQQQQMLQQQQQWAHADPIALCKEVRSRAYRSKEISKNPNLIGPLDELVTRFEQALRGAGVVGTTQQGVSPGAYSGFTG